MSINTPASTVTAPTMFADDLFNNQALLFRRTPALADTENFSFVTNQDPVSVMNGFSMVRVSGTTDIAGFFSVTGGDTVTIANDMGTDFSTTFGTDTKCNIDINAGALRVENQLGATATISIVQLISE